MPTPIGAITISPGQTYTQSVGTAGTVGAVVIANESPYSINASAGSGGRWIVAQTVDILPCNTNAFNGTITLTTDNYLSNASDAPSFLVYLTAYAPGEPIYGTFPAALSRLTSGSSVATQLVNDGNTNGTNIIESTPAGATQSYWLARNDGTFQVWSISNNVLTDLINLKPGSASAAASLVLQLLEVIGAAKLDSGHIYTDGNGNLTVGTTSANSMLSAGSVQLNSANGGAGGLGVEALTIGVNGSVSTGGAVYQIGGASGPGIYGAHQFTSIVNGSQVFLFQIGAPQGVTPPLAWIDGSGVLHSSAPVSLIGGNQETGKCGGIAYQLAGGLVGFAVNFKTVLANVPTSITLTMQASLNYQTLAADHIDVHGFQLDWQTVSTGTTQWLGAYTTVGNCLLAVDVAAQTFDHHCDACGHVSQATPLAQLRHTAVTNELTLSYVCPACGACEAFNTRLTAADEDDETPQGRGEYLTTRGVQARLIRQSMTALGLQVEA